MADFPNVHAILLADDVVQNPKAGVDLLGVKSIFTLRPMPGKMTLAVFIQLTGVRTVGTFTAKISHAASGFEVAASAPREVPAQPDPTTFIQYAEHFSEFLVKEAGEYELQTFWNNQVLETRRFRINK